MAKITQTANGASGLTARTNFNTALATVETDSTITGDGTVGNGLSAATALAGKEDANANIQLHIASTANPHAVIAADVGLGNVDNTADVDKPVSTAQQTAIDVAGGTTQIFVKAYGSTIADIQLALNAAKALVAAQSIQPDGAWGYDSGGVVVVMEAIVYIGATGLILPYNVYLQGSGPRNTVIQSSYDGQIIRSEEGEAYGSRAGGISNLRIVGDRLLTSQSGISLLRPDFNSSFHDLEINSVGGNGLEVFQSVGGKFKNIYVNDCVGIGILVDEGVNAWGDLVSNGLPSNAASVTDCISNRNDGASLKINSSNGIIVSGGFYQNGYHSSPDGTGNNIEITGDSRLNVLDGIWVEGQVNAHLYVFADGANLTSPTVILKSSTLAVTGTNRGVICEQGSAILENLVGQATPYPLINGSQAPYRCNKSGTTGRITYRGPIHTGKGPNGNSVIEDENGNDHNLELYAHSVIMDGQWAREYGAKQYFMEDNASYNAKYYASNATGWDAEPWLQFSPLNKNILLGDGAGNDIAILTGSGTPEAVVTANTGSLYTDITGGAGATLYIKESGVGDTGWVAK